MSTKEELLDIVSQLNTQREQLHEQRQQINDLLEANYQSLHKATMAYSQLVTKSALAGSQYDWPRLLDIHDHMDVCLRERRQALQTLFPNGEIAADGYYPDIMQAAIKLRFDEKSPAVLEEMAIFLTSLLPVIKELHNERQGNLGKSFNIMEPSLSRHGSYRIHFRNNQWELTCSRFKITTLHTTDHLLTMLQYLQAHMAFTNDE